MNKHNNKTLVIASCAAALAALTVYLASLARYSSSMPFWDDYDAVLGFLDFVRNHPDQLWPTLTMQHNEHRLVFSRLLFLADYQLNGHLDMRHVIFLGNAGWLACVAMLWLHARRSGIALAEFAPVLIVLLAFSHRELMVWGMGSTQQYFQLAFSIASILLLTSGRWIFSLVLFVIAAFTGGGGLFLAPVIGGYHIVKRQWRALAVASAVILLTAYVYFIGLPYVKPAHHPTFLDPRRVIGYTLTFMGSAFQAKAACYVLAILLLWSLGKNRRTLFTAMPAFGWIAVYIFVTGLGGALARSNFGTDMARSSRYSEYSLLLIAMAYLGHLGAASQAQARARVATIGLAISTTFFAGWYWIDYKPMLARFNDLESGVPQYPDPVHAGQVFARSCESGLLERSVCAKGGR